MESYIQYLQEAAAIYESIVPVDETQLMFEDVSAQNAENDAKTKSMFSKIKTALGKVVEFLKKIVMSIGTAIKNLFISKEDLQIQKDYEKACEEFPELKGIKFEVDDFKEYMKNVKIKQAKLEEAFAKQDADGIENGKKDLADALAEKMGKIGICAKDVQKFFADGCKVVGTVYTSASDLLSETTTFAANIDKNKDYNNGAQALKAAGYESMRSTTLGKAFARSVNSGDTALKRSAREVYRNMKDLAAFCRSRGKDPAAKAALKAMMMKSPICRGAQILGHGALGYQLTMWGHGIEGMKEASKASMLANKATRNSMIEAKELYAAGLRVGKSTKDSIGAASSSIKDAINSGKGSIASLKKIVSD